MSSALLLFLAFATVSNQVTGALAGTYQAVLSLMAIPLLKPLTFGGFLYFGPAG
jgi:hypothetical protein